MAAWFTCVDSDQRVAVVATNTADAGEVARPTREIIAVARHEHVGPHVAEGAEVVADCWQGRGLGA